MNIGSTGKQLDKGFPLMAALFQSPNGFDTYGDAKSAAEWATLINSNPSARCFILPSNFNFSPITSEDPKVTGSQYSITVKSGERGWNAMYARPNAKLVKQLRSLNGKKLWMMAINKNNMLEFISKDGVKVQPIEVQYHCSVQTLPSDSNNIEMVNVSLAYVRPDEIADYGDTIEVDVENGDVDLLNLIGIVDCGITVLSSSTSEMNVRVYSLVDTDFMPSGLLAANFELKKAGVPVVATVAEETDGTYTLSYTTTAGSHTIGLAAQPNAGLKGYETEKVTSVTIA